MSAISSGSQSMSLGERAGEPFNKWRRRGDFVPRDNSQPSEIGVRRVDRRWVERQSQVGSELMIGCAVVGAPRTRIVLALSLGPRETHDDRQLRATVGAGGIVPFEAKAMEGIVLLDPTVRVSRSDNRCAMDLKPMAPRSDCVTGLMKRRRPSDRFAHATRAIHIEDRRQVTLHPTSRLSLRCGARRPRSVVRSMPAHTGPLRFPINALRQDWAVHLPSRSPERDCWIMRNLTAKASESADWDNRTITLRARDSHVAIDIAHCPPSTRAVTC